MADQISLRDILARRQALKTAIIAEAEVRVMAPQTGWIATAEWTGDAAEPITQFDSTWIVPPNPSTQSSQVIFLFNSLEITGARILQPVLSWGPISDVPGSGPFWTIASWYVGNSGEPFYLTQPKRVNPGQKLTGRITMYYNGGGLFDYGCEFVGIDGTKLIAGNLPQLVSATETLEAYQLKSDSDYPNTSGTTFTSISLRSGGNPIHAQWSSGGVFPDLVSVAVGGAEVNISYPRSEA